MSKELLDCADFEAVGKHMQLRAQPLDKQHAANRLAGDVSSRDWLKRAFKAREQFILNELAGRLFAARQNNKQVFEVWMLEESDNVQALATAYGENIAVEQFDKAVQEAAGSPAVQAVLGKLFSLYALDRIAADGVFFLQNGLIDGTQSAQIAREAQRLCTELGKDALELTAAFGIPNHMHHAPIANNWIKYNETENNGELAQQAYRSKL